MSTDVKELEKRMLGAMEALKKEFGDCAPAVRRSIFSIRSWSRPMGSACRSTRSAP